MSDTEKELLRSFLRCGSNYLEFGTGGSTVLACSHVKESVMAVESNPAWLRKVQAHCSDQPTALKPRLFHADIGPVVELGYPRNDRLRDHWPRYHDGVWPHKGAINADLYLIDGRFRVACFIQVLLRAQSSAIILIHDFANRPQYHVIREFAREIAAAESLSAFQRRVDFDPTRAGSCLADHCFDPN